MKIAIVGTALLCAATVARAEAAQCDLSTSTVASFGKNHAWKVGEAVVYRSPLLRVDADGAPDSYRVDGNGLSHTCDGVLAVEHGVRIKPGQPNWETKCEQAWAAAKTSGDYSGVAIFGFLHDARGPKVQKAGDPLPRQAYITTTFVEVPGAPEGTQRRYIDATAIPYVVLPESLREHQGVANAALAAVYRPKTGTIAYAVFGDTGGALDEASVRLHEDLGGHPLVRSHGVTRASENLNDNVVVAVFPKESSTPANDAAAWRADIASKGASALARWGGADHLKACAQ
jgi:hypothetical protein